MEEQEIKLLESQGYLYNSDGYITDVDGNYVDSVTIGDNTLRSSITEDFIPQAKARSSKLEQIKFTPEENSAEDLYTQQERALDGANLDEFIETPDETVLKKGPFTEERYNLRKEEGEVIEKDVDALERNKQAFSEDSVIRELDEVSDGDSTGINELKAVRAELKQIEEEDQDVDGMMEDILEEDNSGRTMYDAPGDWIIDRVAEGIQAVSPTGAGMNDSVKRKRYEELKAKEMDLANPAIKNRERKELELLAELKEQIGILEESKDGMSQLPDIKKPWDDEHNAIEYEIRASENRLKQLENYRDYENQNFFMRNLYNPLSRISGDIAKDLTWSESAHYMRTVYGASGRLEDGTATDADKAIMKSYAKKLEHEEFMGSLPSLSAVYDTVVGLGESIGFMAQMWSSPGKKVIGKVAKKAAKKKGVKYMSKKVLDGLKSLDKYVPTKLKPFARGTVKTSGIALDIAAQGIVVPLGMGSTYSNTFEQAVPVLYDEKEDKFLVSEEVWNKENTTLDAKKVFAEKHLMKLSEKEKLSPKDKEDLKMTMSFLGIDGEIEGVKRSKAIPTYDELKKDLKNVGFGSAFYDEYTKQVAEVTSENAGRLGFGKMLGGIKVRGVGIFDNKVGRAFTKTNKAVNKASGGMIHSIFDEQVEENLVPLINYGFQGRQSELYSMMNLDAQKDVIIQTTAMKGLFRIPGAVQSIATKEGRAARAWRKKENKFQEEETGRLSDLYKSIASADVTQDLGVIIDLTAIPGVENNHTLNQIALLKAQGKTVEAKSLIQSLFSYNLMQAIKTGTVDKFEKALDKLAKRRTAETGDSAYKADIQDITEAKASIKSFKEYVDMHGDKVGSTEIVQNLMSRDINKKKLEETKKELSNSKTQHKEEYDAFEDNFKKIFDIFMEDGTRKESIDSGRTMLDKRFENPEDQKEYTDLLIEHGKKTSPEVRDIIEKALVNTNGLKESIKAQDRLHIELTSDKKQYELSAKGLVEKDLYKSFYKKGKKLTKEEIDDVLDKLPERVKKTLDAKQMGSLLDKFEKTTTRAQRKKDTDKKAKTDKKASKAAEEISPEPIPKPPKSTTPLSKEKDEEDAILKRLTDNATQDRLRKEMGMEDEELSSPRGRRKSGPTPEEAVEGKRVIDIIAAKLEKELGHVPDFQDFITSRIEKGTYEEIEEGFDSYKNYWKLSGRDISNADNVYSNTFEDVDDILSGLVKADLTPDEVTKVVPEVVKEVAEKTGKPIEYDDKGKPMTVGIVDSFLEEDGRTNDPRPKAAHSHLDSKRIGDTEFVVTSLKLRKDKTIPNHFILSSDFIMKGDEVVIKVNDVDDVTITSYNTDGSISVMTWGQYKALKGSRVAPGTDLYKNMVPMIAYKVVNGEEVVAFNIHNSGWYNTKNVSLRKGPAEQLEIMKDARAQILSVRENVLDGNNKMVITERRFGNVDSLRGHANKTLKTINEATGESKITILVDGKLYDELGKGKTPVPMKLVNDLNKKDDEGKKIFGNGQVFDVRQVGLDQETGKPQYMAFPVITPSPVDYSTLKATPLNRTAFNNIKYAILANAVINNQDNPTILKEIAKTYGLGIAQALEIQKSLQSSTGINISRDLNEYVDMFIYTHNYTKEKVTLETISNSKNLSQYPLGKTYVKGYKAVSGSKGLRGTVNFFKKSKVQEKAKGAHMQFGEKVPVEKSSNFIRNLTVVLADDTGLLNTAQMHTSAATLGDITHKDKPLISLGPKGTITETEGNYENYLKDNYQSNIISHEITKQDGGKEWITDVQPMIYYKPATEARVEPTPKEVKKTQSKIIASTIKVTKNGNIADAVEQTKAEIRAEAHQKALDALPTEELKAIYLRHVSEQQARDQELNSRRKRAPLQNKAMSELETNQISSLTKEEQIQLIASLKNSIINSLDFTRKDLTLAEIASSIEESLDTFLGPQIANYKQIMNNLSGIPGLESTVLEFQAKVDKLESVLEEKSKLVSRVEDSKGDLIVVFERLFGAVLEEDLDEENSQDENYSTSFLEKDLKLNFSAVLRLSLFGIERLQKNKEKNYNFANLVEYEDADKVLNKLLEVTTTTENNWESVMDKLEERYSAREENVFLQLKNKLEKAPQRTKNEILYKTMASKLTMYSVLYKVDKESGAYELGVIDSNSSKDIIKIPAEFERNFLTSSLVHERGGNIVLNKTYAKGVVETLAGNVKTHANTDFKLNSENIDLVNSSFESLGIFVNRNTVKKYIQNLRAENKTPYDGSTIIGLSAGMLGRQVVAKGDVVLSIEENKLFRHISSTLKGLVNIEISLNGTSIAKSMRVAGKTMQGVVAKTMAYDMVQELIPSKVNGVLKTGDLFKTLANAALTKNNFIIDFLKNNETFRDVFSIDFVSLEASKQMGQASFNDRGVDKLPETDAMITEIGFATSRRDNVKIKSTVPGLSFRVGQMYFPALADKGRMLLLRTALVDIKAKDATITPDGPIELNDPLIDFVSENLFVSELNRILMSYNNEPTNTVGFDKAAKMFLPMPILNTASYENNEGETVTIHEFLKGTDARTGRPNYELNPIEIINAFKPSANKLITSVINNEVTKKVSSDGKNGTWVDAGFYTADSDKKLKHLDTNFLGERGGENELETIRIAATDFVVNNLLNQSNIYQLFLGDMAYFSKDKMIAEDELGDIDFENIDYQELSRKISVIVDKRAAMLIAPGGKLANSDKEGQDDYIQLQVNDVKSMSPVIERLIETKYGEVTQEEKVLLAAIIQNQEDIDTAYTESNYEEVEEVLKPERKALIKELEKTNDDISSYFDIEGTDAQEYTTWGNHIDMLMRQGKLTEEEETLLVSAYNKMSAGKFEDVTPEEIATVMQPVKPAYTGTMPVYNKNGDVLSNRPVYIKSSSFPLIPQLTQGLKLDKVREHMERLEKESGKMVRMSYQTANKIGAINTNMTMDDLYNKSFEELYQVDEQGAKTGLLAESSLVLKTKNFKIQQETPYKVDKFLKKGEDNSIRMGSQFWKVILGGGVNLDDTRAIFPNKFSDELLEAAEVTSKKGMLTGMDLDKLDFYIYNEFSSIQKQGVYDEIGLDPTQSFFNLSVKDQNKAIKKLTDILKDEIVSRGYPDYLQDSIDLIKNIDGTSQTEIPIFFDSNSYKFESLLLSVISTKLIEHRLPGSAHISTSSEGFERVVDAETLTKDIKKGITWLDPNHGDKLEATTLKDGTLISSEVLIQSHYRVPILDKNGRVLRSELIDMTSDEYSTEVKNSKGVVTGRILRLDRLDPELINQFSFRIPTSSHQSGVIIKVAGFLPPASGDLLAVPSEHTVQLGEDYDIDKRYIYKSNYKIAEDGAIVKIQYEAKAGKKDKIKMLENSMIDVYKSVYESTDPTLQSNIFKTLSVADAKNTSGWMDEKLQAESRDPLFTPLSDTYQKGLIKLGADGKGGIGVHSNAVTLEAQFQRLPRNKKVQLLKRKFEKDEDGNSVEVFYPSTEVIGDLISDGELGRINTIDGNRAISDVHSENQNSSTDNINEQIMGKRNENSTTMGVFALMAHRGFDKSRQKVNTGLVDNEGKLIIEEIQMTSVFMNQPILREFVEKQEAYKSMTSGFAVDTDAIIIKELVSKYSPENIDYSSPTEILSESDYDDASKKMTPQTLWDGLSENAAQGHIQVAVLQKFMRFKAEADQIREYQQLINLSTSKLGISYFEVVQRIETLNKLATDPGIENIRELVGHPALPRETEEGNQELIAEGHTLIGDYYWMPTTKEGVMLINSLRTAQDVMSINFPYQEAFVDSTIAEIFANKQIDPHKKSATNLTWKYEIMAAYKDFVQSAKSIGIFAGNVNSERQRLFFDTKGNKSLASFISELKQNRHDVMKNPLLASLDPRVDNNTGRPSIIQHVTEDNTSFDKSDKYEAFKELMLNDTEVIGVWNGEQITQRDLAQDLATYAYLANAEKGAISFRNFINLDYFKIMGITEKFRNKLKAIREDQGQEENIRARFIRQYYQHYPEKTNILSSTNAKAKDIIIPGTDENVNKLHKKAIATGDVFKEGQLFTQLLRSVDTFAFVDDSTFTPKYISTRNTTIKLSDNQYNLFKLGSDGFYHRIPTLGTFGLNEYNFEEIAQKSLIETPEKIKEEKGNNFVHLGGKKFPVPSITTRWKNNEGIAEILQEFYDSEYTNTEYKKFIEELQDYIDLDVNIEIARPASGALGAYNHVTNTILIHPNIYQEIVDIYGERDVIKMNNIFKEIVLEEVVHSITANEMKKYIKSEDANTGEFTLIDDAPIFAVKLKALFDIARTSVPYNEADDSTYYSQNIYEFMAGMFVSPDYRALVESKNKGFIKKFQDMLRKLLGSLYEATTGKTLAYNSETFKAIYDLLKAGKTPSQGITIKKNPMKDIIDADTIEVKPTKTSKVITVDKTKSWGQIKDMPVYSENGVNVMRKGGNKHFGNPFTATSSVAAKNPSLILLPTIKDAVDAYTQWIKTGYAQWQDKNGEASDFAGNKEQRTWILEQINQGKLDNQTFFYMKDKGEYYSHADALKDLVLEIRPTDSGEELNSRRGTIKKDVPEVFDENPELSKIGTEQQYSEYIKTIFPDSVVKDIVYHGGNKGIESFDKNRLGEKTGAASANLGFFFSDNKDLSNSYISYSSYEYIGEYKKYLNSFYTEINKLKDKKDLELSEWNKLYTESNKLITKLLDLIKRMYNSGHITTKAKRDKLYAQLEDTRSKLQKLEYEDHAIYKKGLDQFIREAGLDTFDNMYVKDHIREDKQLYQVILDINNPSSFDKADNPRDDGKFYSGNIQEAIDKGSDSTILTNVVDIGNYPLSHTKKNIKYKSKGVTVDDYYKGTDYVVFDPNQIHILGSNKDVEGFKSYVNSKETQEDQSTKKTQGFRLPEIKNCK